MRTQIRLHDAAGPGRVGADDQFINAHANFFHRIRHPSTARLQALMGGVVVGAHHFGWLGNFACIYLLNDILSELRAREIFISAYVSEILDPLISRAGIGNVESDYWNAAADRLVQYRLKSFTVQDRDSNAVGMSGDCLVQDRDEIL